jgi:hypothetical protein
MLRATIHEAASMAAIQANLVMTYAEIGDDRGLEYATRNWVLYTRTALLTLADLKALNAQKEGHERGPRE